jgi:hypothetical protein
MPLAPDQTVTDVVSDFLSAAPTLEEITHYRLPEELQQRAHELLDKLRAGNLSTTERAEMEEFRQIDHLLTLIKAKARLHLKAQA